MMLGYAIQPVFDSGSKVSRLIVDKAEDSHDLPRLVDSISQQVSGRLAKYQKGLIVARANFGIETSRLQVME